MSRYRNQPIKEIRGIQRINRQDHYLVHWEDTPDSEDTWIPANQLENVHNLMFKWESAKIDEDDDLSNL